MNHDQEINKALAAHGSWKLRLTEAVATGTSKYKVAEIETDTHCEFGHWLYHLPAEVRSSASFPKVKQLHADFHKEAARILALATSGHKAEAEQALAIGGRYSSLSGQLAMALSTWKGELARG